MAKAQGCCCSVEQQGKDTQSDKAWLVRYAFLGLILSLVWYMLYTHLEEAATYIVFDVLAFAASSQLGAALHFFLYDIAKIMLLLLALIYAIAWLRASLPSERIRHFLSGKKRGIAYTLAAFFGAVTPFCSCSSVPLFLGFTSAGLPLGITMAFLITSPLINEVAVVMLFSLLGWQFALVYVTLGLLAGILGGAFMDAIHAERWLQPTVLKNMQMPLFLHVARNAPSLSIQQRHRFAAAQTRSLLQGIWKWVIIGVGVGAALHGFVPANWFAQYFGAGQWWTVPLAVFVAIPLYTNVTGIVPIMESLLTKGLPLGTTMAFCMSAVAASVPEMLMLRQVMTTRLQLVFLGYLWCVFTLMGWILNLL